ncbi:CCA tRNA nucleotidyltransferase [Rhodobium gokarnense]|uniref:Poly(A) polymerase n=1 Tax=Rhodobium gokarnense TaxID=364296 RepID=A0ABT3H5T5_9HYPH|nr:CCA tRNA nucleotidyltransferase [Rhodobium gokarnense]MCW2305714.1 poly(A) polymerase [Rhodobium gokarnense]
MVTRLEAGWLVDDKLQGVLAALNVEGDEARIVGGAIRNTLLGVPVSDIDIATTARPETVVERAEAAGFRAVPTGIEHGTVTLVVDHTPFEVTTLREDIETFGRKATVRFGRDWEADARRRDFTMNALYAGADGTVYDLVGGRADCLSRKVRFIGNADERIHEDYLRILRFFRFHASYGDGPIDRVGLLATVRGRSGLRHLSAERIGQEMRRLALAPGGAATTRIMADSGILQIVLGGIGHPETLGRLTALAATISASPDAALAHAALSARIPEDAERVAERLRLSNEVRRRMVKVLRLAPRLSADMDEAAARLALYRSDAETFRGAVLLAWAWSDAAGDDAGWRDLFGLAGRWPVPRFPVSGRDLVALGIPSGPAVGTLLSQVEDWWIGEGFAPGREAALDYARGLIADGVE